MQFTDSFMNDSLLQSMLCFSQSLLQFADIMGPILITAVLSAGAYRH